MNGDILAEAQRLFEESSTPGDAAAAAAATKGSKPFDAMAEAKRITPEEHRQELQRLLDEEIAIFSIAHRPSVVRAICHLDICATPADGDAENGGARHNLTFYILPRTQVRPGAGRVHGHREEGRGRGGVGAAD